MLRPRCLHVLTGSRSTSRPCHSIPAGRSHKQHTSHVLHPLPGPSTSQQPRPSVCCHASAGPATHYDVLGIAKDATDTDVKQAFRKLALKLHPDVNKTTGAVAQFTKAKEAYEVLSDASLRGAYDIKLRRKASSYSASTSYRVQVDSDDDDDDSMDVWFDGNYVIFDINDSDDDSDSEEVLVDLESGMYTWASTGNNMGSSYQSSWQANRKKQTARASQAQSQAQSSRAGGRPRSGLSQHDRDELLENLGPEVRATAENIFGRGLRDMESIEELAELLEVMDSLQSDMGIQFNLFNNADEGPRRRTPRRQPSAPYSRRKAPPKRTGDTSRAPSFDASWDMYFTGDMGMSGSAGNGSSQSKATGRRSPRRPG